MNESKSFWEHLHRPAQTPLLGQHDAHIREHALTILSMCAFFQVRASSAVNDIVEKLKTLTLLEASELVKEIESVFQVSNQQA